MLIEINMQIIYLVCKFTILALGLGYYLYLYIHSFMIIILQAKYGIKTLGFHLKALTSFLLSRGRLLCSHTPLVFFSSPKTILILGFFFYVATILLRRMMETITNKQFTERSGRNHKFQSNLPNHYNP